MLFSVNAATAARLPAVDVAVGIMAVDPELHSDQEAALLESGSTQRDLWGINLYPDVDVRGLPAKDGNPNIMSSMQPNFDHSGDGER